MKIPHAISSRVALGGFTLAETVLSATIASSALITALSLMVSGVDATKDSHREVASVLLARRVAGEIQRIADKKDTSLHVEVYDVAQQPLAKSDNANWSEADYAVGAPQFQASYLVSWQLTPPSASDPQVAGVKITVESPASAPKGNRHTYTYATLLQ
jgi:hypothetical protein